MKLSQCVWTIIRRRPQAYVGLLFNAVIVTAVWFAYVGLYWQPDWAIFQDSLRGSFLIVSSLLVGVSFLALLYFLATLYRRRRRQFGLLFFLGMRPRQGYAWVAIETLLVGGCGIVGGVGLGVAIHMVLFSFLQRFPGMSLLLLQYHFPSRALCLTVLLFLGLFVVLAVTIPFVLSRLRLRLSQRVDGEVCVPHGRCRQAWISLSSLGTIVVICFFLPFHWLPGEDEQFVLSSILLVLCAVLSFLGIYQFYRQGMMVVAQSLRRWKWVSWRGLRLLWLGVLDRRLQGYAFSFSLLSVVFIGFMIVSCIVAILLGSGGSSGTAQPGSMLWASQGLPLGGPPRYPQDPAGPFAVVYRLPHPLDSGPDAEIKEALQREIATLVERGWEPIAFSLLSVPSLDRQRFRYLSWIDYQTIRQRAGVSLPTLSGAGNHALSSCATCQGGSIEHTLMRDFGVTQVQYGDRDEVQILPNGVTQYVRIWVVGDRVYRRLSRSSDAQQDRYVGYLLPATGLTAAHLQFLYQLVQGGKMGPWSAYNVALEYTRAWGLGWAVLTWVMLFLAFTVAAGNFLLFRIELDLGGREREYWDLLRLGVPMQRIRRLVTQQMGAIFFSPVVLSVLLSICALVYAYRLLASVGGNQSMENFYRQGLSLVMPVSVVFVVFLGAQGLIFLLIRKWVVRSLGG